MQGERLLFVTGQRILSPVRGYLPHSTMRYQVILPRQSLIRHATCGIIYFRWMNPDVYAICDTVGVFARRYFVITDLECRLALGREK